MIATVLVLSTVPVLIINIVIIVTRLSRFG
jgi:hypothetical protein